MAHRVAPIAEIDLDEIWYRIAKDSASTEIATRFVDSITDRFSLLAQFPEMGRSRETDFGMGFRSFPVGEYIIVYRYTGADIQVVRVLHGRRSLESLFPR